MTFASLLAASILTSAPVEAEIRVSGDVNDIHLHLRDATIAEALTDLSAHFDIRWRTAAALDRRITAAYEGPLRRVLQRLLNGYDFVMKFSAGRIELSVFDGEASRRNGDISVRAATVDTGVSPDPNEATPTSTPAQVAVGIATAKGPHRRTRPR